MIIIQSLAGTDRLERLITCAHSNVAIRYTHTQTQYAYVRGPTNIFGHKNGGNRVEYTADAHNNPPPHF